jgi:hypothetical protein
MNSDKNMGEFWTALGSPPRPAFYLIVTVAMDLGLETPEGPPVVTKEIIIERKMPPGVPEPELAKVFEIGGTIRDNATSTPIANAQVRVMELNRTTVTNQDGRFTFDNLAEGEFTLRVSAAGFATKNELITVPGTVLNEHDVNLTT